MLALHVFLLIVSFGLSQSDSMSLKITDENFNDSVGLIYDRSNIEIRCECVNCTDVKFLDPNDRELEKENLTSSGEIHVARVSVNEKMVLGQYKCVSTEKTSTLEIPYRLCPANSRSCQNNESLCIITSQNGKCDKLTSDLCKRVHNAQQSFLFFTCKRQRHSPRHYDSLCEGIAAAFSADQPFPVVETKNLLSRVCSPYQPYDTFTVRMLDDDNSNCESLNDISSPRIPVGGDYYFDTTNRTKPFHFYICVQCKPKYKIDICYTMVYGDANGDSHDSRDCPNVSNSDIKLRQDITHILTGSAVTKYVVYSRLQGSNNDESRTYFFLIIMDAATEIVPDSKCAKLNCTLIYMPPNTFSTKFVWKLDDEDIPKEDIETTGTYSVVNAHYDGHYTCVGKIIYQRLLNQSTFEQEGVSHFERDAKCKPQERSNTMFIHLAIALGLILAVIILTIVAYCLITRYKSSPTTKTSSTFSNPDHFPSLTR